MAAVGVKKSLKIHDLLEALLPGLLFFSYIRLLDSGGGELWGRVLPCRPEVVVDQPLLAAGPL